MAEAEYAYRNISTHPVDLADGANVGVGEYCLITAEDIKDPHNEDLIASELLLAVDDLAEDERKKAVRRVKRREEKVDKDLLVPGEHAPEAEAKEGKK